MSSPIATSQRTKSPRVPKGALRLQWNPKQSRFLKSVVKYLNLEGGVRAGKSFVLCWKVLFYGINFPGIQCALTRWTQDGLDAQLKPLWRSVCRMAGVSLKWNALEEYDELPNGSIVYLRALKSSEETQRYSKLAGLTLAILGIDQAEEVPGDVYRHYVPARLSQPRYPHQVIITPNPPMPNSWIAQDWPDDNSGDAEHLYIHTTMYDNAGPLGEGYIVEQEAGYQRGTQEHRRLVEGKRGLVVAGVPIWAGHFDEQKHRFDTTELNPHAFLCEAWDFGTVHPCVTWTQFLPGGVMAALGGVMGIDMALEQFAPIVAEYRSSWFPGVELLQQTCDPAGDIPNNQGSPTGVTLLRAFGVYPSVRANANHPPIKAAAIEVVVGYLSRSLPDGSACFRLNPRFVVVSKRGRQNVPVLQQALEGGYCYDEKRTYIGTTYPHLRPPKKDGYFEHPADSLLYGVTAFAPPDAAEQAGLLRNSAARQKAEKLLRARGLDANEQDVATLQRVILTARLQNDQERAERRALRYAQRDPEESFTWSGRQAGLRRGGY